MASLPVSASPLTVTTLAVPVIAVEKSATYEEESRVTMSPEVTPLNA